MDDIARDPNTDSVASVEDGTERLRRKGPVDELAVRSSADDGDALAEERGSRLPVVLPLPADDHPGDDLAEDATMSDLELPEADEPDDSVGPDADLGAEPSQPREARDASEARRELETSPPGLDADPGPSADEDAADLQRDLERDLEHGEAAASPAAAVAPHPADEVLPDVAEPITDPDRLARVILGLLLTVREGLTVLRLAQTCETTQEAVRGALVRLEAQLHAAGFPLELTSQGESIKLWTKPDVFPYLEKVKGIKKTERLSPAALETLAVVAYRQPVFRAEIEAIRGVKVGPMLRTLLDCKLVKIVGRADVPGRPLQYGTTQVFLDRFGLGTIQDLPSVKEFKGLQG